MRHGQEVDESKGGHTLAHLLPFADTNYSKIKRVPVLISLCNFFVPHTGVKRYQYQIHCKRPQTKSHPITVFISYFLGYSTKTHLYFFMLKAS